MRILQLTSHLNVGGITTHVVSVARALAQRGHRVLIASGGGALEGKAQTDGLTHWRMPLATSAEFSPRLVSAARQLAERLRREPVDVLHAHTRVAQVLAARAAHALARPYIATWHGFFRPNLGRRLWPCLGERTIAISEPVLQHLLRDFRVSPERTRLIPHGIDADSFAAPVEGARQQALRERLGLRDGIPVVGTVARLVASKGVDRLIRSLPRIRSALPEAAVLLVGDGEERARLERLAAESGLSDAVHFAGTLLETRVALSLMRVFVFLPARQEGFGLSLLEAMASGCAVVAVRQGTGSSWVVGRGGIGPVVEPEDTRGLADAVTRFLRDPEAARRAGAQAQAVVRERFAIDRMVTELEAVYREVTRQQRPSVPSGAHAVGIP